jgi:hypothetical protein
MSEEPGQEILSRAQRSPRRGLPNVGSLGVHIRSPQLTAESEPEIFSPTTTVFFSADRGPIQQSLERLIAHVYGKQVSEPNYLGEYERISFETAGNLLQNHLIARFEVSTLFQPFAGPPGTPNRLVLLTGTEGKKYFIVARYDGFTNQLLPPV